MSSDQTSVVNLLGKCLQSQQALFLQNHEMLCKIQGIREEMKKTDEYYEREIERLHRLIGQLLLRDVKKEEFTPAPASIIQKELVTDAAKENTITPNISGLYIAETKTEDAFGAQFIKKENEWDCPGCYTRNGFNITFCPCCGMSKEGTTGTKDSFAKTSISTAPSAPGKFSFGFTAPSKNEEATLAPASVISKEEAASSSTRAPSVKKEETVPPVKKEETIPPVPAAVITEKPKFSFAAAAAEAAKEETTTKPKVSGLFGAAAGAPPKFSFGTSSSNSTTSTGLFGSTPTFSFANVGKTSGSLFDEEAKKKAQDELAKMKTSKFGASIVKKDESKSEAAEDDEDHGSEDDYEPDVDFAPVCPLPDLVDVKTGEEDETVIFKERCKLYRFSTDTKEWKERGTGDVKILKNPKTESYRCVMRREQVHKLCANFSLVSGMSTSKMNKNQKACMWFCVDYSEAEPTREQFSAKFASAELADLFLTKFNEACA